MVITVHALLLWFDSFANFQVASEARNWELNLDGTGKSQQSWRHRYLWGADCASV